MIATEASTSSTSFRVTPCPSTQMCHSGSAGRAPAPLVAAKPRRFGNKLATALPRGNKYCRFFFLTTSLPLVGREEKELTSFDRTGRSLGAGGSRPPGSRGSLSKLRRSVGSWRVGTDRPSSSWRWTIGPSSASPGSRPPGAWMSWNGPGWSPSAVCQAGLRSLQSWTLPRRTD